MLNMMVMIHSGEAYSKGGDCYFLSFPPMMGISPTWTSALRHLAPPALVACRLPIAVRKTHHAFRPHILPFRSGHGDMGQDARSEPEARPAQHEDRQWCSTQQQGGRDDRSKRGANERIVVTSDLRHVVSLPYVSQQTAASTENH